MGIINNQSLLILDVDFYGNQIFKNIFEFININLQAKEIICIREKKNLKYIPILTHTQKTQMRLQYRGIQMHVTSRLFKSHCIALKYQRGSYLELCHSVSNDTASFFRHVNLIVTEEQRSNSIENRSQLDGLLFFASFFRLVVQILIPQSCLTT